MGLLIWKKIKPGQKLHWNSKQYHQNCGKRLQKGRFC
nr:unnamed protein product [Callosobruchus analis]